MKALSHAHLQPWLRSHPGVAETLLRALAQRLRRTSEINAYLEDRIERTTKRLYLLRLSHDRLEQDLLSRPTTLRDSITELRRRIAGRAGESELAGASDFLLLTLLAPGAAATAGTFTGGASAAGDFTRASLRIRR